MSECEVEFEFCCTPCRVHAAKVRGHCLPTSPRWRRPWAWPAIIRGKKLKAF